MPQIVDPDTAQAGRLEECVKQPIDVARIKAVPLLRSSPWRSRTTDRDPRAGPCPDRLDRRVAGISHVEGKASTRLGPTIDRGRDGVGIELRELDPRLECER